MSLATIKSGIQSIVKTKPLNVTASRALDTMYKNDGYTREIQISIEFKTTASPQNNSVTLETSLVGDFTGLSINAEVGLIDTIGIIDTIIIGFIQPYDYYVLIRTKQAPATSVVLHWWEIDFM